MTVKVGDKIRILKYKLYSADVEVGDIGIINKIIPNNDPSSDDGDSFNYKVDGNAIDWAARTDVLGTGFEIVDENEETIQEDFPARIDGHYDFFYDLQSYEVAIQQLKVDPYFVSKQWGVGARDPSGALFHILKTIARFGDKNPKEREIKAIYLQIKRLAELEGVELE